MRPKIPATTPKHQKTHRTVSNIQAQSWDKPPLKAVNSLLSDDFTSLHSVILRLAAATADAKHCFGSYSQR